MGVATTTSIIGKRLRRARERAGRTQDDVADVARACGLTWGRSSVAQLESGSRELSLDEAQILPLICFHCFGWNCSLADLVAPSREEAMTGKQWGREWLELPGGRFRRAASHHILGGVKAKDLATTSNFDTPISRAASFASYQQRGEALERQQTIKRDARGEAEQKAARRLGVSAVAVATAAHNTWGHALTAERDRRVEEDAGAGTLAQRRGHVTRQLLRELAPIIKEKN